MLAIVPRPFERRLSRLIAPAPKATIWSRPPAIITFLRKWIIWFWSAKLLWNDTAVAIAEHCQRNCDEAGLIARDQQEVRRRVRYDGHGIGQRRDRRPTAAIIAVVEP